MMLAISGTPGTGKTSVAALLSKQLNANLISISRLLKEVACTWDKERKTRIVEINKLQKAVTKHISKGKMDIVEGHLSHLLNSDAVVILRCSPKELEKRLRKKGWRKGKIKENVQAEILDEITVEALQKHGERNVLEIDTTRLAPAETATIIMKLLNNINTKKYHAGKIDWSEKYKDYLL